MRLYVDAPKDNAPEGRFADAGQKLDNLLDVVSEKDVEGTGRPVL